MKCVSRAVAFGLALAVAGGARADFRPPSVPIVSCDPFFSVWSGADAPTDVIGGIFMPVLAEKDIVGRWCRK